MTLKQLEVYKQDCIKSLEHWKNIFYADKNNRYAYKCFIHYGMVLDNINVAIAKEKSRLNPKNKEYREKIRHQKLKSFSIPF